MKTLYIRHKTPAVALMLAGLAFGSIEPAGFHKHRDAPKDLPAGYMVLDGNTAPEPKPGTGLSCVTVFINVKTRAATFRCTDEKGKRWEFVITPLDEEEKKR